MAALDLSCIAYMYAYKSDYTDYAQAGRPHMDVNSRKCDRHGLRPVMLAGLHLCIVNGM